MKICFYGNVYSAFNGRPAGGGEKQIALIAKVLMEAGHKIYIIDFEISSDSTYKGITFVAIRKGNFIRNFWKTIRDINADIYYGRVRGWHHFLPLLFAKTKSKRFLLGIASDLDVSSFSQRVSKFYKYQSFNYNLKNLLPTEIAWFFIRKFSNAILCQHEGQFKKGDSRYKLFYNYMELGRINPSPDCVENKFIIVGSVDKRKGYNKMLKIAEKLPHIQFTIVGKIRDKECNAVSGFNSFSNITFHGEKNNKDVLDYISSHCALITVSPVEGFPNVFLEAWALGKPVISLNTDLGGIIEKNRLGIYCHSDLNQMTNVIDKFEKAYFDPIQIADFTQKNFDVGLLPERFEKIVKDLKKA